ncbi:hypothetical protein HJC23_013790 [Cyclotella cryptica]|uniref:Cell wall protein n=1 Tax=Cyclotella cryptica TaxID=29204 RepID=A0ABD3PGV0_9STRA
MRLAAIALLALTSNSVVDAFAPAPLANTHRTTSLQAFRNENNNDQFASIDLPKVFLSTLTAATLFAGTFSPLDAIAASSPSATADPLAKEKSLVLTTKTALSTAQSAVPKLESSLKEAQATVAKDEAALQAAEKKVKETKKLLLNVNDKLAEAKGRGSDKLVEVLTKDSGELCTIIRTVRLVDDASEWNDELCMHLL